MADASVCIDARMDLTARFCCARGPIKEYAKYSARKIDCRDPFLLAQPNGLEAENGRRLWLSFHVIDAMAVQLSVSDAGA